MKFRFEGTAEEFQAVICAFVQSTPFARSPVEDFEPGPEREPIMAAEKEFVTLAKSEMISVGPEDLGEIAPKKGKGRPKNPTTKREQDIKPANVLDGAFPQSPEAAKEQMEREKAHVEKEGKNAAFTLMPPTVPAAPAASTTKADCIAALQSLLELKEKGIEAAQAIVADLGNKAGKPNLRALPELPEPFWAEWVRRANDAVVELSK